MTQGHICVVGSVNSDTTYHVQALPAPGETILAHGRFDAPGGKGANQAAALAALGQPVTFIGAVGDDDRGRHLVAHLESLGVDCSRVTTSSQAPTGSAAIVVSDDGENSIVVHPGANHDVTPHDVRKALAEYGTGFVMVQCEIPLEAAVAAATSSGSHIVVNPAPMPPASPLLDELIQAADVLVPNRTELATLVGSPIPKTPDDVIACVSRLDADTQVVVTLGKEGAMVFAEGPTGPATAVSAPVVESVDSSGAGDAFCGALVAALNAGYSLVDATQHACNFAAWTTTLSGAQVTQKAPQKFRLTTSTRQPAG
jgi:ribokinase